MKKILNDINDPKIKFSLVESSSEVDGKHILAKVRGVFFCPNGMSRNGRYYTKELWEKVLGDNDVSERLKNRNMFGTVGHETVLDDKAVLEGLVSHIVTKLEISENDEGIGEALILNTPAGQTLNTILRAGGQMYVSTRANGTLSNEKFKGKPVVDEDTYEFQTVDFVCRPGFLEANPSVAEDLNKLINETKREDKMDEKLIKMITDENAELKTKVGSLLDESAEIKSSLETALDENKHLTGEIVKLEEANKIIAEFNELGSKEELVEKLEKLEEANKQLSEYAELGESFDNIKKALEIGGELSEGISKLTEGSISDIEKALELAVDFRERVNELGTIDELEQGVEKLEEMAKEAETAKAELKAKELAEELGLPVEKVSTLLEKYSDEDIKELYSELSEGENRYKKNGDDNIDEDDNDEDNSNDDLYESKILGKSYSERI